MNKTNVAKMILKAVAIGGVTLFVASSPHGARKLIDGFKKEQKRREKYYANAVTRKLLKTGMIRVTERGLLELSPKGYKQLAKLEMGDEVIIKPKRWDGKYRLVIFDIPEREFRSRVAVRRQLLAWGFARLQNSVWVHPYDCEQAIGLLKTYFGLGNNVLYLIVDFIENDNWLKKDFGLS